LSGNIKSARLSDMKIYKDQTVYEAALERIRYVFDEFENIVVGFSGGKDSTTLLELSLIVAKEKNRFPLKVMWLDQEAEWKATVDYCDYTLRRPGIEPYWMQIPFRLTNSASFFDQFLYCWDKAHPELWLREKSDISYKENIYGTDRFHEIFCPIEKWIFKGAEKIAVLYGMKASESMNRKMNLTMAPAYKEIDWSTRVTDKSRRQHYKFAPLYDWKDEDIWHAIAINKWRYNTIYDTMWRYGRSIQEMRVSSLIHETSAEHSLLILQEAEPETYNKLVKRIGGVHTYSHFMKDIRVHELPAAFSSWKEYVEYLAEKLLDDNSRDIILKSFKSSWINQAKDINSVYRTFIQIILTNDVDQTKLFNLRAAVRMQYKKRTGAYDRLYKV
jgi:predicted phosphoadenosine phosphosulfate sulfurtransferase